MRLSKVHRRGVALVALLLAVSGLPVAKASAAAVPSGFVYRSGRHLMLDGQPYRFVGFNSYGISGCATGTPWGQAELDGLFGSLPPVTMTRTWAFAHRGVAGLEPVVAAAQAHGQKLILSLANAGTDCGESAKDLAWYQGGYRDAYLTWVRAVVTRFKDSPAIGMWEIMNEPGHQSTVDPPTMKAFLDTAAATIKGIDPNHLVSSGAMAEYTPGTTDFELVHSGPDIDVGGLHEYDQDHSDQVISRHLAPTLTPLYKLNKPFIVGESGILAGQDCFVSLAQRADMFRREFDGYFLSGVAGVLIWTYTPFTGSPADPACMHQVRLPNADPTIALVRGYTMPATVPAPTGAVSLQARHTGKCLTVDGGSTSNGTLIPQRTCAGLAGQRFTFQATTDGFYRIVAAGSGKCLDVKAQSYALGTLIQQWDCWSPGPNQQFRLEPADSGYYRLIARHSIKCLRVAEGSTAEGANLTQYDCKQPTLMSQQFKLG